MSSKKPVKWPYWWTGEWLNPLWIMALLSWNAQAKLSIAVEDHYGEINSRIEKLQNQSALGSDTKLMYPSHKLAQSVRQAFSITLQLDKLWVIALTMAKLRQQKSGESLLAALQELGKDVSSSVIFLLLKYWHDRIWILRVNSWDG